MTMVLENPSQTPVPLSARLTLRLLDNIRYGQLVLLGPGGFRRIYGQRSEPWPGDPSDPIELRLSDWSVLSQALSKGDIGFAEAYLQGRWSTNHLPGLLRLLVRNRHAVESAIQGRFWALLVDRLLHLTRGNTKRQARKNIEAHYDLGNAFYAQWLDPTMTYSSALFDQKGAWHMDVNLQEGQHKKIDRAIAALDLRHPEPSTLEIGCGWGGLAVRRLQQHPGRHTGITLSPSQRDWAMDALSDLGLSSRSDIRLQDYRDVQETFDAIVSVEMIEAVGQAYWPSYFEMIDRCLRPGGRAVIQAIVISDHLFDRYRRGTDFIQKYIFPGGMLISPSAFDDQLKRTRLRKTDHFAFGPDYARTLRLWLQNFDQHWAVIQTQGFDDRFARMWRFYLAYCEAGFQSGDIDVVQYTLQKPRQ
jgi:cyclopropane-fatty-acyl-phospholipid synthase